MRPVTVVMLLVLAKHGRGVALVDDQYTVEQFAADAAEDEAFGDGVSPRRPHRCPMGRSGYRAFCQFDQPSRGGGLGGLEDGDTTSGLGRLGCLRRLIWRLPTRLPGHRLVTPGTILRW